jgi:hypothetical protein
MQPFEAASPSVEVNGETVLSFVAGLGTFSDRANRILANHGLENPQPGSWYKQQSWLNAFKEISQTLGPNSLYKIGMAIPEKAKFPPQITSIPQALSAIDVAYRMNHRGGEIGEYRYEETGSSSARMVCRNPYPSDFDRGIIQAMANRFKPEGSFVDVVLDAAKPSRKNGGDSCTYTITW